jgi:hypothetical protein
MLFYGKYFELNFKLLVVDPTTMTREEAQVSRKMVVGFETEKKSAQHERRKMRYPL